MAASPGGIIGGEIVMVIGTMLLLLLMSEENPFHKDKEKKEEKVSKHSDWEIQPLTNTTSFQLANESQQKEANIFPLTIQF